MQRIEARGRIDVAEVSSSLFHEAGLHPGFRKFATFDKAEAAHPPVELATFIKALRT